MSSSRRATADRMRTRTPESFHNEPGVFCVVDTSENGRAAGGAGGGDGRVVLVRLKDPGVPIDEVNA